MKKYWLLLGALGIASAVAASMPHHLLAPRTIIRKVPLGADEAVTIHTAVGFSSLIEFPSRPTSVVLGDQDSFKVEYVGSAITIKPLVARAKSDLFVFTEWGRFNCELVVGDPAQADLLVQVELPGKPEEKPLPTPVRKALRRKGSFRGFSVELSSWTPIPARASRDATLQIEFELGSTLDHYVFDPGAIGVRQGSRFLMIERIDLSRLSLSPGEAPLHGQLVLRRSDLMPGMPLTFVFAVPGVSAHRQSRIRDEKTSIHRINIPIGQPIESERRKNPFATH